MSPVRWLRAVVVAHPELVGLAGAKLEPVANPVERFDLRQPAPAAAAGDGVIVVCSVGTLLVNCLPEFVVALFVLLLFAMIGLLTSWVLFMVLVKTLALFLKDEKTGEEAIKLTLQELAVMRAAAQTA